MSKFSFERDFNRIMWGRTLWLNLLRAFCAGIVWTIIALVSGTQISSTMPSVMIPLITPIAYILLLMTYIVIVKIPILIPGKFLHTLATLAYSFIFGFAVAVGDPLVFLLHRIKPAFVPVEKFDFINFNICVFVIN